MEKTYKSVGWMDKGDVVNGILLSHEKNEILPFVTMWMNFEGITYSEISLKYCGEKTNIKRFQSYA